MKGILIHVFGLLTGASLGRTIQTQHEVTFEDLPLVTEGSLYNIHTKLKDSFEGTLQIVYGHCEISDPSHRHHEIGSVVVKGEARPDRFVWATPRDIPHGYCLHAFSESGLVGRSTPVQVSSRRRTSKRESIADVADPNGPWFDGVAYMASKPLNATLASQAKNASVAIVGAGISGLMTSLLLDSVGIKNWHIFESSDRIGGRIRTTYFNNTRPDQYQYHEMGPMRFPVKITYPDTQETLDVQDSRLLFQLANVLNRMNADKPDDYQIRFIPWIEQNPNLPVDSGGVRLADGRVPRVAQTAANASLVYTPASSNASAVADAQSALKELEKIDDRQTIRQFASNMYAAHKQAIEDGRFHWSEASYLRYALGYNNNITDYTTPTDPATPTDNYAVWEHFYQDAYHLATEWCTVDKGLEALSRAFLPHVTGRITFNRTVSGLVYNESSDKTSVAWRKDLFQMDTIKSQEFDYATVAAPFSKVRFWDLPRYSSLLGRAIKSLTYDPACKVALHYKTRFWEHTDLPIFGGCGSVDVVGIGNICYPPFNMNGTGPGVVLASYVWGDLAHSVGALDPEEYVALAQRAMVDIHGDIAAEQFTGLYDQTCWQHDRHQAGSWANPSVGQQELYIPAYYQTEFKTVFMGDQTSFTQGWIPSALDSAVRGTTQILLDLGLVDEAIFIVHTWMGRWIHL